MVSIFKDHDHSATAGEYVISIDWGDGSASTAGDVVANGKGTFRANGSHTYTTTGRFSITVMVTDAGGATTIASGTANVKGPHGNGHGKGHAKA